MKSRTNIMINRSVSYFYNLKFDYYVNQFFLNRFNENRQDLII